MKFTGVATLAFVGAVAAQNWTAPAVGGGVPAQNWTAPAGNSSMVWTTEVVTELTTVCPAPTAGDYVTTIGSSEYTISKETTITAACPCTISSEVPAKTTPAGGVVTSPAGGKPNGTATTPKPIYYTGAAAHVGAGMGFLGAAAGAAMLL
ncbi:hypothetical protein KCU81_g3853, partial [Aureobasidium melanogenum]|uniref:Uncharacterized protein n=1 Tax=Aureobasidium melanogenum (strain CBS 110374) TaxID=1043003 RepID=A0A074VQ49_AURM1